ncbi:uncharacterized protein LOC141806397 isoform X2 [Halichoeres trimaculatus]|uniref:uncharacterized protein LOC141806397 isoform X2 n=1 Tax=Halichoeres trimaculatus TaxID=147232 RepID=UPI003D9E04CC
MSQAWCSVPCCTNSKRKSPHLSFHDFPVDESVRANWVKAIRRDEGPSFAISRGSTYVCSEHFNPEELLKSTQTNGRTRIKHGAVPSRFYWNDWGSQVRVPVSQRARKYLCASGLDDGAEMSDPGDSTENEGQLGTAKSMGDSSEDRVQQTIQTWQWTAVALDHDYVCHPSPGILDRASKRIRELELNVIFLETELEQMKVDVQQPLVYQYCVTDDDFRFYTRFISKEQDSMREHCHQYSRSAIPQLAASS